MSQHLSFAKTVKMGVTNVKTKPIRFAITIILFFLCLSVAGLGFSILLMNPNEAAYQAVLKSDNDEIIIRRIAKELERPNPDAPTDTRLTEEEAAVIAAANSDYVFRNIYSVNASVGFSTYRGVATYYDNEITTCIAADEAFLHEYGFSMLWGSLPQNETEVAIPGYVFELYQNYGYTQGLSKVKIKNYEDLTDKKISFTDEKNRINQLTIVGVVDCGFSAYAQRFEILKQKEENVSNKDHDKFVDARSIFSGFTDCGVQKALFFHPDTVDKFVVSTSSASRIIKSVITLLSGDAAKDRALVHFARGESDGYFNYTLGGLASADISTIGFIYKTLHPMGIFCVIVMPIFTALMMFNFISATIAASKKNIGVLRAVGATNATVFGIFASESIFTALVSFVMSIFGANALCAVVNTMANMPLGYQWVFVCGALECLLVLALGLTIAFVGSLIPILRLLRKKPVEIMRK